MPTFELLVFGRGREPLVVIPIKTITARQELPVELTPVQTDDSSGNLILNILGEYQASITLTKPE